MTRDEWPPGVGEPPATTPAATTTSTQKSSAKGQGISDFSGTGRSACRDVGGLVGSVPRPMTTSPEGNAAYVTGCCVTCRTSRYSAGRTRCDECHRLWERRPPREVHADIGLPGSGDCVVGELSADWEARLQLDGRVDCPHCGICIVCPHTAHAASPGGRRP